MYADCRIRSGYLLYIQNMCRLTSDFSVVLSKYLGSTEPKTISVKIVRLILIMMMAFCN